YAGLLSGKKYTCYPGVEANIKNAEYTSAPCEVDGNIVTGKSMGCATEFGLGLLGRLKDAETVESVEKGIVRA
nr:DJ-1/PfpI family protein [Lachnospiraceae bacterium]